MKKWMMGAALLLMTTACQAQHGNALPAPDMNRKTLSVMQTYQQRQSTRTYDSRDLSQQDLADLLWAATGVNRENGNLTMPSCRNWQEIRVYVFDKKGVSLYDPKTHSLIPQVEGDYRKLIAAGQDFVLAAPVCLLIVADMEKPGVTDARSHEMVTVDAGICSENINLFCAAAGLCTVPRASHDAAALQQLLGLSEYQIPILNNPVGYPAK